MTTLAYDLGLALRFGLSPRQRPAQSPEYRRVLERLEQDITFLQAFDDLLDGLGLTRLSVDAYGISLGCRDDSPFAMRLADFRTAMKREDRVVYGLVLLAIAGWCYPRAADLEHESGAARTVRVHELTEHIEALAQRVATNADADAEAGTPELREAWRSIVESSSARPGNRRTTGTLSGKVKYTLEQLSSQGLLRHDDAEEVYKTTRAFRTQVREMGACASLALVRHATRALQEDACLD